MNLAQFRKIHPALSADLKAVFEKHGFDLRKNGATINPDLGTVSIRVEIFDKNHVSADGTPTTPEAEYFKQYCKQLGAYTKLKAEWLNRPFKMGGFDYVLVGMRSKGKAQMIVRRVNETANRVMTEDALVAILERVAA